MTSIKETPTLQDVFLCAWRKHVPCSCHITLSVNTVCTTCDECEAKVAIVAALDERDKYRSIK